MLIAEDEELNYLFLKEILSTMNFNIIHKKNGLEALEECKTNDTINIVLMDIKMPIMNGYDAAKEIKKIRPQLPIIAQSAYALDSEISKYGNAFDSYITKPIKKRCASKYFIGICGEILIFKLLKIHC